jgi:hypothetical protein
MQIIDSKSDNITEGLGLSKFEAAGGREALEDELN